MSKPGGRPVRPALPADANAAPSLARSLKIVAWGLLGIRRAGAHRADVARVSPVTVVVAGLLALLALVGLLMAVVRWAAAA